MLCLDARRGTGAKGWEGDRVWQREEQGDPGTTGVLDCKGKGLRARCQETALGTGWWLLVGHPRWPQQGEQHKGAQAQGEHCGV